MDCTLPETVLIYTPKPFQLGFVPAATDLFFEIQALHADIMFFVVIISIFVVWQLFVQWQLFDKKRVFYYKCGFESHKAGRTPLEVTHNPELEMF